MPASPRPAGQLIWFHAASVGESLSVLSLIKRLGERLPQCRVPDHLRHAHLCRTDRQTTCPLALDINTHPWIAPGPCRRFLDHWTPNAAIFVESEIWPRLIVETRWTRHTFVHS